MDKLPLSISWSGDVFSDRDSPKTTVVGKTVDPISMDVTCSILCAIIPSPGLPPGDTPPPTSRPAEIHTGTYFTATQRLQATKPQPSYVVDIARPFKGLEW